MKTATKTRMLAIALAVMATVLGVAMAIAGAAERGGTPADKILIGGAAVLCVLCVHLLPSMSRSVAAKLAWVLCLVAAIWGHATFFAAAADRAGSQRIEAHQVEPTAHAVQLAAELRAIDGRPAAAIAADAAAAAGRAAAADAALARCEHATPGQCGRAGAAAITARARTAALGVEDAQAARADAVRRALAGESHARSAAQAAASAALGADQIAVALGRATGTDPATWSRGSSIAIAVLVEILGALLWAIALADAPAPAPERPRGLRIARRATTPAPALPESAVRLLPAPVRDVIDLIRKGGAAIRGRAPPVSAMPRRAPSQKCAARPTRACPA